MQTPEYEERISQARAQVDSDLRLGQLHQSFSECIHHRLSGLPLGVQSRASWMPRELPTLVLRDATHYRWATVRFIRDPECEGKGGKCGNCMFHYQMVFVPVGAHADSMAFIVERTLLTSQAKGEPWKDIEEMFLLTPEQFILEGRLGNWDDIVSIHQHLHPQEQAS